MTVAGDPPRDRVEHGFIETTASQRLQRLAKNRIRNLLAQELVECFDEDRQLVSSYCLAQQPQQVIVRLDLATEPQDVRERVVRAVHQKGSAPQGFRTVLQKAQRPAPRP